MLSYETSVIHMKMHQNQVYYYLTDTLYSLQGIMVCDL